MSINLDIIHAVPKQLKTVLLEILNNELDKSMVDICKDKGYKINTVYSQISKLKREKNINFYKDLLEPIIQSKLSNLEVTAFNKLKNGIEKNSYKHLELFYRLRYGSLKDTDTNININDSKIMIMNTPSQINRDDYKDIDS